MISWLLGTVRTRLMDPLCAPSVPAQDRCYVDEVGAPSLLSANELVLSSATTAPGDYTIGGGGTLLHTVQVDLTCADGDLTSARARRDRLTMALLLPAMRDPSLGQAGDGGTETGIAQELSRLTWTIQWADLSNGAQLAAFASVVFTATADWRPTTLAP